MGRIRFMRRLDTAWAGTLSGFFVLVTVTVVSCSLVAVLGRWHWLADLLSHFVVQYALLAMFASVGLVWCKRPGWAILAAGTCMLQFAQIAPYLPVVRSSGVDAPCFKVLQFNVGAQIDTLDAFPGWLETRSDDFDVIVLFEVDHDWKDVLRQMADRFPTSALELRESPFGIAVFTRLAGAEARVRHTAPDQLPTVVVTVPGRTTFPPMTVLASHAPAPNGAAEWKLRNEHFAALAEYAANQTGQVVLIGDLNTTVWSPWYRRLTQQTGLRSAQLQMGYRTTWSPYHLPLLLGLPLDHVLLSEGFTAAGRSYPPRMSSDHRPIVTTIGTRPGAQPR